MSRKGLHVAYPTGLGTVLHMTFLFFFAEGLGGSLTLSALLIKAVLCFPDITTSWISCSPETAWSLRSWYRAASALARQHSERTSSLRSGRAAAGRAWTPLVHINSSVSRRRSIRRTDSECFRTTRERGVRVHPAWSGGKRPAALVARFLAGRRAPPP